MEWIHEKQAVEGKRLYMKSDPDERVWMVADVYRLIPRSEKWVKDRRKAHDRWRAVTDV
jgi:hypothetical protein